MRELVPELHDLLKLTRLEHDIFKWSSRDFDTFEPFFPNTRSWQGVKEHHCGEWCEMGFPTELDTFYLCIADDLASHISRLGITISSSSVLEEKAPHSRVNKLWNPLLGEAKDVRLHNDSEIIPLFEFFSTDPSWEKFLKKYEYILRNRAEDAHPGKNITSLYTHCKLSGQFYRILTNSPHCVISQSELEDKDFGQIKSLIGDISTNKWQLMVARCKIHFLQKPFRARDLNIFGTLEDLMEEISTCYPDNILLRTSNELLLVLFDDDQLSSVIEKAHQRGFWVEVSKNQRPVRELQPRPESMAKVSLKYENLYRLPQEISPPICELCQAAKATKRWPEDYVLSHRELCPKCRRLLSQNPLSSVVDLLCEADRVKLEDIIEEPLTEQLCENCFSSRAKETKLPKMERWSHEKACKLAWLKLNLDLDELLKTLKAFYLARFVPSPPSQKADIRFSVIGEFQEDYSYFLEEFRQQIQKEFKADNVENILGDFLCIKVRRFRETLRIFQIYQELMNKFFPAFLNLESSPLKIVMVCASVKFPFFEVWRTIEGAREDIFVSLQAKRTLRAPIKALESLIKTANTPYHKSALHKLTKIEETSETLAELTFQNRKDKDHRTYSVLAKNLRASLDFASIFTFARLIED